MKKVINGRLYDTNAAKELGCANYGSSRDFTYWSECLYRKKSGEFFLYGTGGAMSKYAESSGQNSWGGGSRIIPMTVEEARKWVEEYLDGDEYESIFGVVNEVDENRIITFSISNEAYSRLAHIASAYGISETSALEQIIMTSQV